MLQWMVSGGGGCGLEPGGGGRSTNWQCSSSSFQETMRKRSWSLSKMDSRNFSSALSPDTDILASSPGPGLRHLARSAAASLRLSPARPWPRPRLRGGGWREGGGPGQPQPAGDGERGGSSLCTSLLHPLARLKGQQRSPLPLPFPFLSGGLGQPRQPPRPHPARLPLGRPRSRDTRSKAGPAPRSSPGATARLPAPAPAARAGLPARSGPARLAPAPRGLCPPGPAPARAVPPAPRSRSAVPSRRDCSPVSLFWCSSAPRQGSRSSLLRRTFIWLRKTEAWVCNCHLRVLSVLHFS